MNSDSFDALFFDLVGVVIDFDFQRAFARWAETTSCAAAHLRERFCRDEAFKLLKLADLLMRHILKATECLVELTSGTRTFLMDGCHLCWRKTWHFRLARQGVANVPLYTFTDINRARHLYWLGNFVSHFQGNISVVQDRLAKARCGGIPVCR